jgi:FkbM family methyltransferase
MMPQVRGASLIGSLLLRVMPFLDKRVFLELKETHCILDLRYRTHFAFLMNPFEYLESCLVFSILNKGDVFFDIGSNWGYYAFLGSVAVGDHGKVVAVEANRNSFHKLQNMITTSGLSNVLPFNLAISNVIGEKISISLPWYKVDTGGFIKKANGSWYDVSTKTLDLLWLQLGSPRVKMIKIDTEGAESLILDGGSRFLAQGLECAALIEVESWARKRFGREPISVYKRMQEYGFCYVYGVDQGKLIEIEMPADTSRCFLGNVFFSKTDISDLIGESLKLNSEADIS